MRSFCWVRKKYKLHSGIENTRLFRECLHLSLCLGESIFQKTDLIALCPQLGGEITHFRSAIVDDRFEFLHLRTGCLKFLHLRGVGDLHIAQFVASLEQLGARHFIFRQFGVVPRIPKIRQFLARVACCIVRVTQGFHRRRELGEGALPGSLLVPFFSTSREARNACRSSSSRITPLFAFSARRTS